MYAIQSKFQSMSRERELTLAVVADSRNRTGRVVAGRLPAMVPLPK